VLHVTRGGRSRLAHHKKLKAIAQLTTVGPTGRSTSRSRIVTLAP
jgi:hypothetical protein